MSSGMNMQEAEKVAENMSYRQAVINCLYARCVPYRKATKIKMKQLLEIAEKRDEKIKHDKQIRADERNNVLSTLSKLIESDYNSKECKLLLADLCEMLL